MSGRTSGYGIEARWWPVSEFDGAGNYSPARRGLKADGLTPQALADILRAAARDVERSAGIRPTATQGSGGGTA